MNLLFKHSITPHPDSIALKSKELASRHDFKVKEWMNEICRNYEIQQCATELKKEVTSLLYLPSIPSLQDFEESIQKLESISIQTPREHNSQSGGKVNNYLSTTLSTLDTSALNLSSEYKPSCVAHQVCKKLKEKGISESTIKDTVMKLQTCNTESVLDAANFAIDKLTSEAPKGYQIIGDNLDLHLNVRH